MSSTIPSVPNRSIDQVMKDKNKDLQALLEGNKNLFLALVIAVMVAVISFGFFSSYSLKSKATHDLSVYQFEMGALKDLNDKSDAVDFLVKFKKLHLEIGNYIGLIPVVIKASDVLINKGHLNQAQEVLDIGLKVSKNDYAKYFILSRLAVVYEDLGMIEKAIESLQKMNTQSIKIFEGKNYLDLGRLYLIKGEKEKAKASFQFVIEKAKDEFEFVKIAKLYLAKI